MSNIKDTCCNPRLHDLVLAGWPPCCATLFVVVHRRWAHAPVIHAASHFAHKKRVAHELHRFLFLMQSIQCMCGSFFYNYWALLGGTLGRRSSAMICLEWFETIT